jgi:hypothetical protein
MAATSTYRRSAPTRSRRRLWLALTLALAVVLAGSVLLTASAQAVSLDREVPKATLMKGSQVLQKAKGSWGSWHVYEAGKWVKTQSSDTDGRIIPRAAVSVRAGSKLHIRINKPQRPDRFSITAFRIASNREIREGRPLEKTYKPVKRDGKTVAWDVYFRLKRPDRHYLLQPYGKWKRVPGTHISYGDGAWYFHVKTR